MRNQSFIQHLRTRIVCFIFLLGGYSIGNSQDFQVTVRVDPRVELMSILSRLADFPEYGQASIPSYAKDAENNFGRYRDHEAVERLRKLRRMRGIAFNAPLSLAVHLKDTSRLEEKVPLHPVPDELDDRWKSRSARNFLKTARRFVEETRYKAFVQAHQSLYVETAQRVEAVLNEHAHLEWFDDFFGARSGARYIVVPGMLTGPCSYGMQMKDSGGSETLYSVLALPGVDEEGLPIFGEKAVQTAVELVVHEFSHSYINPLVDRHVSELRRAGRRLFTRVAKQMKSQAYSSWKTVMYESFVRACEVRYLSAHGGEMDVQRKCAEEARLGFVWVEPLAELLGEYENRREDYPDLDAFLPRIAAFFDEYVNDATENQ